MKVAIYNCFAGQPLAETGLSRRLAIAASRLGWRALETASSVEINEFNPDFVLALHFFTPKLTEHPTYGCMWSPPAFFADNPEYVKRILSYDGFLSSSPQVTAWIQNALRGSTKPYFIAPFFTSCHEVPYKAPALQNPRLLYAGTNWDRSRHRGLFDLLDREPFMDVYGTPEGWRYLRHSYRGLIPLDGESILQKLNTAGVGLCLHRPEHCSASTPSLRIFEIAAAGAIAICQPHSFIEKEFGDSVLYLPPAGDQRRVVAQIVAHMQWISSHHGAALDLSRKAYEIFAANFAFEKLLAQIADEHTKHQSHLRAQAARVAGAQVDIVLHAEDETLKKTERALQGITRQEGIRPKVTVVATKAISGMEQLLAKFAGQIPIEVLPAAQRAGKDGGIGQALRLQSEYFTFLNDLDVLYPRHLASLVVLLEENPSLGVAYGGAISVRKKAMPDSAAAMATVPDSAALAYFEPPFPGRLRVKAKVGFPNAFLARRTLLVESRFGSLLKAEGLLFLLLALLRQTDFLFSAEATMQYEQTSNIRSPRFYAAIERRFAKLFPATSVEKKICIDFIPENLPVRPSLHHRIVRRIRQTFARGQA